MKKNKKHSLMRNKRGQEVIIGIMIMIMAMIIFVATLPAIKSVMDTSRGCSYLNCAGYTDRSASSAGCSATNQTYTTSIQEDKLTCTILDLGLPYLILGVLVGLVGKLIHGRLTEPPAEASYGGGY